MRTMILPSVHRDPWLNILRGYVTNAVEALLEVGIDIQRSHLDPYDPRDATIVYSHVKHSSRCAPMALVWDEETGWRQGRFLSGQPGERTQLAETAYLGEGVLLNCRELAARVVGGDFTPGRKYRSAADVRDGLDDTLREMTTATFAVN